tara:strand:+ start:403 stop:591 length:189 start_codon:yes stop_codon:yes gene_type:complete
MEFTFEIRRSEMVGRLVDSWTASELRRVAEKMGMSGDLDTLRRHVKFTLKMPTIEWRESEDD